MSSDGEGFVNDAGERHGRPTLDLFVGDGCYAAGSGSRVNVGGASRQAASHLSLSQMDLNAGEDWSTADTDNYANVLRADVEVSLPFLRTSGDGASRNLRRSFGGGGGSSQAGASGFVPPPVLLELAAVIDERMLHEQESEGLSKHDRKKLVLELLEEDEEMMEDLIHDDEDDAFIIGMSQYSIHVDKYLCRAPYRVAKYTGLEWVFDNLADPVECYNMYRMDAPMFHRLHALLVQKYGLASSTKSHSIEALGMFLWMVGSPQSVRNAKNRMVRSMGTVHHLFHKVLDSLELLGEDIVKPLDSQFRTLHTRLKSRKFYPFFKDCIGAIDGTHVQVTVPRHMCGQYTCRKKITTQNVMACCDFDMWFTFANVGWPGSVHDMTVFNDSTTSYAKQFPFPPSGKYYLVDSGYTNRIGYLAPYKGSMYHHQEFRNTDGPQGVQETFNFAHSSLRNVIERAFGVLKMKWRMLLHIPPYSQEDQSRIILACMTVHNFMRNEMRTTGINDRHFHMCDSNENYVPPEAFEDQPEPEVVEDSSDLMNHFRDSLAEALYNAS